MRGKLEFLKIRQQSQLVTDMNHSVLYETDPPSPGKHKAFLDKVPTLKGSKKRSPREETAAINKALTASRPDEKWLESFP